jgi:hypothetical protein
MNLPDFLVIGAGKSGTTSIDNYLKQHPDLYVSPVKEPNFFALEGKTFLKPNEDREQFFHFPWSVTTLEDYLKLFAKARPDQLKGETSPMYMYDENAAQNIKRHIPDVKLIAILRQPAERIYSRYLHLAEENRVPGSGMDEIFDRTGIWWKRNDLVNEGFYHKHLSRFFTLFPRENIMVILHEELIANRSGVIKDIFTFLNVRNDIEIDSKTDFNPSGIIKSKLLDKFIGKRSPIFSGLSKISPTLYDKLKKNSRLVRYFGILRKKNLNRPILDRELKRRITDEIYKDDILNLQQLLNRDLKHWLD